MQGAWTRARNAVILHEDEDCSAALVQMSLDVLKGWSVMSISSPQTLSQLLAEHAVDVLVISAQGTWRGMTGVDVVESLVSPRMGVQVIYVAGNDPSATHEVYRTDHVYLLDSSPTKEQLEAAYAYATTKLDTWSDRPIMVHTKEGDQVILPSDITYVESDRRLLYVHTTDATLRTYGKLGDMMRLLPTKFVMCHQSYLVNLSYVKELGREHALLTTGEQVLVSQKRRKATRDALTDAVARTC